MRRESEKARKGTKRARTSGIVVCGAIGDVGRKRVGEREMGVGYSSTEGTICLKRAKSCTSWVEKTANCGVDIHINEYEIDR